MKIKTLLEMPRIVTINKTNMIRKFEEFAEENNYVDSKKFKPLGTKDFYILDGDYESYIVHYIDGQGVTAFMQMTQSGIRHNGKSIGVITQGNTLNEKKISKGFTLNVFKELSKTFNRPILIDYRNSFDMSEIFKKWIKSPDEYGIKNFFVYDNILKKTLKDGNELVCDVWESLPESERYSILFDFYDLIKENIFDYDKFNESLKGTKCYFNGRS